MEKFIGVLPEDNYKVEALREALGILRNKETGFEGKTWSNLKAETQKILDFINK